MNNILMWIFLISQGIAILTAITGFFLYGIK